MVFINSRMMGDTEKMVAVGVVWGSTNALIRRGALLWDNHQKHSRKPSSSHKLLSPLITFLRLLFFWQYSLPFAINLSASATFFAILSHVPISLAVPITNATTFAATAAFGMLLGERTRLGFSFLGIAFIVAGVSLCIA